MSPPLRLKYGNVARREFIAPRLTESDAPESQVLRGLLAHGSRPIASRHGQPATNCAWKQPKSAMVSWPSALQSA